MQIGDLVKHITQSKWGIILEIVDYSDSDNTLGIYCNILWNDEEPFWIWDDIVRVVKK